MRKGIEDSAYGNTMHTYLPWYGVTAGSILGGAAGSKLVPKKYQLLGTLGGGLLGTAAGLHGGEALGKRLDRGLAKSAAVYRVGNIPFDMSGSELDKKLGTKGARIATDRETGRSRGFGFVEAPSVKGAPKGWRITKEAEAGEAGEYQPPHPALTAAKSIGGLGVGMLAGYGGMKATDAILQKTRGKGLPRGSKAMWAVPIVTGAGGLAYTHMQQKTLEKMRQDHLKRQEKKRGSEES
jgi:hypothetical protein